MKILAYRPEGGSIVELGEQETSLLQSLSSVMDGEDWQARAPRNVTFEGDIEKAFLAVIYFIKAKLAVNQIRDLADELDEAIGVKNCD